MDFSNFNIKNSMYSMLSETNDTLTSFLEPYDNHADYIDINSINKKINEAKKSSNTSSQNTSLHKYHNEISKPYNGLADLVNKSFIFFRGFYKSQ